MVRGGLLRNDMYVYWQRFGRVELPKKQNRFIHLKKPSSGRVLLGRRKRESAQQRSFKDNTAARRRKISIYFSS